MSESMNSLIDSNVGDVGERLIRLIKQQTELLESNQETVDAYRNHICSQIVDNATMQPIYSQAYVSVVKLCVEAMQESPYVEMGKWIRLIPFSDLHLCSLLSLADELSRI